MSQDDDDRGNWISVGGPVDESRVSLCLYGRNLDPKAISGALGTEPSLSHQAGDRVTPRVGKTYEEGAWIFDLNGLTSDPSEPEASLQTLLSQVPADREFWSNLGVDEIRIKIMLVVKDWNRGFSLSPTVLRQLADFTESELDFEIWFEAPEPPRHIRSA